MFHVTISSQRTSVYKDATVPPYWDLATAEATNFSIGKNTGIAPSNTRPDTIAVGIRRKREDTYAYTKIQSPG